MFQDEVLNRFTLKNNYMLQTTLTSQLSFTPHKSSASTPSLSSNQEEDETEAGEVFSQADAVPNGHLQTSCSHSHIGESSPDCIVTDRASIQSSDLAEAPAELSCSCPDVSTVPPEALMEKPDLSESSVPQVCISAEEVIDDASEDSSVQAIRLTSLLIQNCRRRRLFVILPSGDIEIKLGKIIEHFCNR